MSDSAKCLRPLWVNVTLSNVFKCIVMQNTCICVCLLQGER